MMHVYDDKTGNPRVDNAARRMNQRLTRSARKLRVHAKGRARRKYIKRVESARYARLIGAVTADLVAAANRQRA